MNRRTFMSWIGAATAVVMLPARAFATATKRLSPIELFTKNGGPITYTLPSDPPPGMHFRLADIDCKNIIDCTWEESAADIQNAAEGIDRAWKIVGEGNEAFRVIVRG